MKIVTLNSAQIRIWTRNVPVLVYEDDGEAVIVDGKPRTPTPEEFQELLKCQKKKKLFDVTHDGKKCHFVNGREFLKRTLARACKNSVQLRSPNQHILCNYKPKFPGHDIFMSRCRPVEDTRPVPMPMTTAGIVKAPEEGPQTPLRIPEPEDCPECSEYAKPIGCRPDEHHFVCRWHDPYERLRIERIKDAERLARAEPPKTLPNPQPDSEIAFVLNPQTGEQLREATPDEVEAAKEAVEATGMPLIEIGGETYAIATTNLVTDG